MTKLKKNQIVTKLQNSNCDKIIKKKPIFGNIKELKYDKTLQLKMWKTKKKMWQNFKKSNCEIVTYFSKNNLTPQQLMKCSQGSFSRFSLCFILFLHMKLDGERPIDNRASNFYLSNFFQENYQNYND